MAGFGQPQVLDELGEVLARALQEQACHLAVAVGIMLRELVQGEAVAVVFEIMKDGH